MRQTGKISSKNTSTIRGRGLLNTLINKLPFELHIPGYQYCGPGTNLEKRLARGDKGVNPLDEACRVHDIVYSRTNHISERNKADQVLEKAASNRLKASNTSLSERMAALGVKGAMKIKRKLGMGFKKRNKKPAKGKKGGSLKKRRNKVKRQRIIPAPKKGGFLPFLLPLLGALGAVGGGAASIAKAVNDAKAQSKQLDEQKRHDLEMEQSVKGKGLYLRPYKGYGLYSKPYQKNYP